CASTPPRLLRALPQPRPAPHLRRALGRLPPPGPDRDLRDLLEPRSDAGRLRVRARGRRLDLPELPRVGDRAPARDARLDGALLVARAPGRLVEPGGLQRRRDGLAWGKRLRGENACAIAYFGDGATSEGSFHEGANFAAVMRAPLVLFCNNNGWAISTPVEAQTHAETLAAKAVGYGMPAARVDGLDILAVYEATREAVARARAGEGPTFIEAVSYRAAPHATAADPQAYIDVERVEEEKKRECVGRYEGYLRRAGIITDEMAESIRVEAEQAMRDGI